MSAILGVAMRDGELREVPKLLLDLGEVEFALASPGLVRALREIGALQAAGKFGKTNLYEPSHVAEVKERWKRGEFKEQFARLAGGRKRELQEMEESDE